MISKQVLVQFNRLSGVVDETFNFIVQFLESEPGYLIKKQLPGKIGFVKDENSDWRILWENGDEDYLRQRKDLFPDILLEIKDYLRKKEGYLAGDNSICTEGEGKDDVLIIDPALFLRDGDELDSFSEYIITECEPGEYKSSPAPAWIKSSGRIGVFLMSEVKKYRSDIEEVLGKLKLCYMRLNGFVGDVQLLGTDEALIIGNDYESDYYFVIKKK